MNYRYKAMNCNGKEANGFVDAKTESDAATEIKQRGMFPVSITIAKNNTPEEQPDNYMKYDDNDMAFIKKTVSLGDVIVFLISFIIGFGAGILISHMFKI